MKIPQPDFLKWAFSNCQDNVIRGIVAEYIVYKAVGATAPSRTNWDAVDVVTPEGITIEVKAAGTLQTWNPTMQSQIQFDISRKDSWIAKERKYIGEKSRYSDMWVFCIHQPTSLEVADVFDTSQWSFLVASSQWLNEEFNDQKSVRKSILIQKGLEEVSFSSLHKQIVENANKRVQPIPCRAAFGDDVRMSRASGAVTPHAQAQEAAGDG